MSAGRSVGKTLELEVRRGIGVFSMLGRARRRVSARKNRLCIMPVSLGALDGDRQIGRGTFRL